MGVLTGIPREATKGSGGIKEAWVANFADITNKVITAGVLDFACPANAFKKYVFSKEAGASYVENVTGNVPGSVVTVEQLLVMQFNRQTVSKRNELLVLAKSEVIVIVEDFNGELYAVGVEDGADVTAGAATSGAQKGEANTMSITIRSLSTYLAPSISAADYSAIKAGTAIL